MTPSKNGDPTIAFLLEFLLGFFVQWFGWGHIYNGRVGKGLLIMLTYWVIQGVNVLLMFVVVGLVTAPITWVLYLVLSSISAKNDCAAGAAGARRRPL